MDLRSAIAKKACATVELMAIKLKNSFENAADRYISANCLLKLILSGNKILAEAGHQAIIVILQNVHSAKLVIKIAEEIKSKNPVMRLKSSQYTSTILSYYPISILGKTTIQIEDVISNAVNDASAETRAFGRESFLQYSEFFQPNAKTLLKTLSAAAQKAIAEGMSRRSVESLPEKPQEKPKKVTRSPMPNSKGNKKDIGVGSKPHKGRLSNPLMYVKDINIDKPETQKAFFQVQEPNPHAEIKDLVFEVSNQSGAEENPEQEQEQEHEHEQEHEQEHQEQEHDKEEIEKQGKGNREEIQIVNINKATEYFIKNCKSNVRHIIIKSFIKIIKNRIGRKKWQQ